MFYSERDRIVLNVVFSFNSDHASLWCDWRLELNEQTSVLFIVLWTKYVVKKRDDNGRANYNVISGQVQAILFEAFVTLQFWSHPLL